MQLAPRLRPAMLAFVLASYGLLAPGRAAGKEVVMAVASTFTTMDPYDANDTISLSVHKAFYEGLYGFDREMKVVEGQEAVGEAGRRPERPPVSKETAEGAREAVREAKRRTGEAGELTNLSVEKLEKLAQKAEKLGIKLQGPVLKAQTALEEARKQREHHEGRKAKTWRRRQQLHARR